MKKEESFFTMDATLSLWSQAEVIHRIAPEKTGEADSLKEADDELLNQPPDATMTLSVQLDSKPVSEISARITTAGQDDISSEADDPYDEDTFGNTPAARRLLDGEVVINRTDVRSHDYELGEELGKGGMGVVYAARQVALDRRVAVKLIKIQPLTNRHDAMAGSGIGGSRSRIRSGSSATAKQRRNMIAEATVTGDLDHPNIMPVYDLGQTEDGVLFYAMKEIKGIEWRQAMSSKTERENLNILLDVCDAIAFAHDRGVVHRDLKPENIMLGAYGEVIVMDWGMAIGTCAGAKAPMLVEQQTAAGTPCYMAPEMARCQIEKIGPASDIYLLGAILFEVLTGTPPHTGRNVFACIQNAANHTLVESDRTDELMQVALKAMAGDPAQRYASVQDFVSDIEAIFTHLQSIGLADRAIEEAERAGQTGLYEDYARALFGVQEAVELWPENQRAIAEIAKIQLAYAKCAIRHADLDLAESLLDPQSEAHAVELRQIQMIRKRDTARQLRGRFVLASVVVLVCVVVSGSIFGYFRIRHEKAKTDKALQDVNDALVRVQREKTMNELQWRLDGLLSEKQMLTGNIQDAVLITERLNEMSPDLIGQRHQRLAKRLAEHLAVLLGQPEMDDGDIQAVDQLIGLLNGLDPSLAKTYQSQLRERQNAWRSFVDIQSDDVRRQLVWPEERLSCESNYQLDVKFELAGRHQGQLQIESRVDQQYSYLFVLNRQRSESTKRLVWVIAIFRDGRLLAEREVDLEMTDKVHQLHIKHLNSLLMIQLDQLESLLFDDMMISPVRRDVSLRIQADDIQPAGIMGRHQVAVANVNPVATGDALFAEGKLDQALEAYNQQKKISADPKVDLIADSRRIICLSYQNRLDEALQVFQLLVHQHDRYLTHAACVLWLHAVTHNRWDIADRILMWLSQALPISEFARWLPVDSQNRLLEAYRRRMVGLNLFKNMDVKIANLIADIDQVTQLFDRDLHQRARSRLNAMRALHMTGQMDEAKTIAESAIADSQLKLSLTYLDIVDQYGWLMRDRGETEVALKTVTRLIHSFQTGQSPDVAQHVPLVCEKVRLLVHLNRWEQAEQEVDQVIALLKKHPHHVMSVRYIANVYLLAGFLAEHRGEDQLAKKHWRDGYRQVRQRLDLNRWIPGMTAGAVIMIGALSGDMDDQLAESLLDILIQQFVPNIGRDTSGMNAFINKVVKGGVIKIPKRIFLYAYMTPQSKSHARASVYRNQSFHQTIQLSLMDLLAGLILSGWGDCKHVNAEDIAVMWELVDAEMKLFRQSRNANTQTAEVISIGLIWKDLSPKTALSTWRFYRYTIPSERRLHVDYIVAVRHASHGRHESAKLIFKHVLKTANPGTLLHKAAQKRLGVQ